MRVIPGCILVCSYRRQRPATGNRTPTCPEARCTSWCIATGWAGLTRFTASEGSVSWTPEQREVALILEGSVRIEIEGGDMLELGVGDVFSLPPGVETTWHVSTPFKEMWVLASS
jgi:uncharacterized cupin superfamily protein